MRVGLWDTVQTPPITSHCLHTGAEAWSVGHCADTNYYTTPTGCLAGCTLVLRLMGSVDHCGDTTNWITLSAWLAGCTLVLRPQYKMSMAEAHGVCGPLWRHDQLDHTVRLAGWLHTGAEATV